jgi:hypothetical protein
VSITAALFLLVYVTGLALAFWRPVTGLCAYLWAFYMNPQGSWWGVDVPYLRYSLIAAAVTLVAYGFYSISGQRAAAQRVLNGVSR